MLMRVNRIAFVKMLQLSAVFHTVNKLPFLVVKLLLDKTKNDFVCVLGGASKDDFNIRGEGPLKNEGGYL